MDLCFRSISLIPCSVAAAWVRAAFHDCGDFAGNGGCDGSLALEIDRSENNGLQGTIAAYKDICDRRGCSMADALVFGGSLAVEVCGGPALTRSFRPGRIDATAPNAGGRLPGPHMDSAGLTSMFMGRMGFTAEETVALLGAHTLGASHGSDGQGVQVGNFDNTPNRFDNAFFKALVANPSQARLPSDANLMTAEPFKSIVQAFADGDGSNSFFPAFASAFTKMTSLGAKFDGVPATTMATATTTSSSSTTAAFGATPIAPSNGTVPTAATVGDNGSTAPGQALPSPTNLGQKKTSGGEIPMVASGLAVLLAAAGSAMALF